MVGTAPRPRRWLLVEHDGPWPVDAVAGSGIAPGVLSTLQDAASRAHARVVLVRRHGARGRRRANAPGAWAVVDSAPGGGASWGRWSGDSDLLAAADELAVPRLPAPAEPVLLVCTHGRHDTCCAVRGRPVAAALSERWPAQTWECSHVGGDRFAANLVLLPDGWYYGGLDAGSAVGAVTGHLHGDVDTSYVRGMTSEPPAAQAAVVATMRARGGCPAGGVRSTAVRARGERRWEVDLEVDPGPSGGSGDVLTATVAAATAPPAVLTCRATAEWPALRYEVTHLGPRGAAPGDDG